MRFEVALDPRLQCQGTGRASDTRPVEPDGYVPLRSDFYQLDIAAVGLDRRSHQLNDRADPLVQFGMLDRVLTSASYHSRRF